MRELVKDYETWDVENYIFKHTLTVWKEGENYYQVVHPAREGSFDLDSLPTPPAPIPMELFKGTWIPSLTESPNPAPSDSYLKRPPIVLLDETPISQAEDQDSLSETWTIGDHMLSEAKIYELLKQHPHPNICVCYGCVRDGDCFTALCLKKYRRVLDEAVREKDQTLDPPRILDGISKGLQFLHDTMGLVHNDINPANIMLDDEGNAVIVDFDSCIPIGQEIGFRKAGTYPWAPNPEPTVSLPETDLHGLKRIAEFLKENIQNIDSSLPSQT